MKLSELDLDVLSRLSKAPDGRYFLDLLQRLRGEADGQLRILDEHALYRAQGRAQCLDELVAMLEEADQRKTRSDQRARPYRS